jgi:hypothetical protein
MAAMVDQPDPAAIFACAKSLHDACLELAEVEPELDLSDAYQGMDTFMREVMRVGEMFEKWACRHVAFNELADVWSYFLEERFGPACLETMDADSLGGFDSDDCLRIAFKLRLPMWADGSLPLPVCVEALNPLSGAIFHRLRIQTVRNELNEDGGIAPFTEDDDPFDENYGELFFTIYGVHLDGLLEPIAHKDTYQAASSLLADLLPGIGFREQMIAFQQSLTSLHPCECDLRRAGKDRCGSVLQVGP